MIDNKLYNCLPDGRSFLPPGTVIDLAQNGGRYRITGDPVGYGGSGILYPAVAMISRDGKWVDGTLQVAVKECFPAGLSPAYSRDARGEIRGSGDSEDILYNIAGQMLRSESEITGKVFEKGFRLTPMLHTSERVYILFGEPAVEDNHEQDDKGAWVHNSVGILERLDEKGKPLSDIISGAMNGWQCFHLFGLILRAIREVHEAGYLHGDIQEHNIFVKGWEEDEMSCEVSLVDFGSARELLEDGATAVIADRLLFTTKGYAAPECLEKNDGTLRLTPAADLYSAGILLLRMLNGRMPERRSLKLAVGGKYLLQRRAKQISIPSGTVSKINEVLTGLLQEEPMQRYQSVQEVLDVCGRIEKALAPRTSALEATDYDAFISYCHEPSASYVADRIQKKLERYRIPKSVKRPDGRVTMGKVFMDRAELNAGGDMEEHLRSALAHSAYLIVVLSPGVMESPWVEREIRMFLETHSRDQILLVLAEGEPEEVTPPVLLEFEKEVNGVMRKTAAESLAADVRGSSNKERDRKLNTEIYRLLAPILGCGFDDLVRRQKAYTRQRNLRTVSVVLVLALCVLGVINRQARQIRNNRREELYRESVSLAEQSAQALASGDRKKAVQLALAGLPDPEKNPKDMPATAHAEAALLQAMGYYPDVRDGVRELRPEYLLQMDKGSDHAGLDLYDGYESFLQINEDASCMATMDNSDTVYVWNLSDGSLIQSWDNLDKLVRDALGPDAPSVVFAETIAFEDSDTLLIFTDLAILAGNIHTGELKIRGLLKDSLWEAAYIPERNEFITCNKGVSDNDEPFFTVVDAADAQVTKTVYLKEFFDEAENEYSSVTGLKLLWDGRAVAVSVSAAADDGENEKACLVIWYPEEDCTQKIYTRRIFNVEAVSDDKVLVHHISSDAAVDPEGESGGSSLTLIDVNESERIWTTHLSFASSGGRSGAYLAERSDDDDYILLWCGSAICVLSGTDGSILRSDQAEGPICGSYMIRYAGAEELVYCTENGEVDEYFLEGSEVTKRFTDANVQMHSDHFIYDPVKNEAYMISRAEGKTVVIKPAKDDRGIVADSDIKEYWISENCFICSRIDDDLNTVYSMYRINGREDVLNCLSGKLPKPFAEWKKEESGIAEYADQDRLFICGESVDTAATLTARSTQTGEIVWQTEIPMSKYSGHMQNSDGSMLLYEKSDSELFEQQVKLLKGIFTNLDRSILYRCGFGLLDLKTGDEILSWGPDDFASDRGIDKDKIVYFQDPCLSADGKYIFVLTDCPDDDYSSLHVLRVKDNKWIDLPEKIAELRFFSYDKISAAGNSIAVFSRAERSVIMIDTKKWKIRFRLSSQEETGILLDEKNVSSMECPEVYITPDERFLLVADYSGKVQVRDAASGELFSEVGNVFSPEFLDNIKIKYDPALGVLQTDELGFCSEYYLTPDGDIALIEESVMGNISDGIFRKENVGGYKVMLYPFRSLEEMMTDAREYCDS